LKIIGSVNAKLSAVGIREFQKSNQYWPVNPIELCFPRWSYGINTPLVSPWERFSIWSCLQVWSMARLWFLFFQSWLWRSEAMRSFWPSQWVFLFQFSGCRKLIASQRSFLNLCSFRLSVW